MGKGDKRTKRGKIFTASNGNCRPDMQKRRAMTKAYAEANKSTDSGTKKA